MSNLEYSTSKVGLYIAERYWISLHFHASRCILLLSCAIAFLIIDFLFFSLSQTFIFDQPFLSVLKSVIREGIAIELIQYLIAILGALAADENIWSLGLLIVPRSITYVVFKNMKETRSETVPILEDMADAGDLRDIYTGGHSKREADLVHQTLAQMNISGPEAIRNETSARLHDIEKIGIPDDILIKPGKLLSTEMDIRRDALSSKQAIQILLEGRGQQWDAGIVNAFVDMITRQLHETLDAVSVASLSSVPLGQGSTTNRIS